MTRDASRRRWLPILVVVLCAACGALAWGVWRLSGRVDGLEARLARRGGGRGMSSHIGGAAFGMRVEDHLFRGLWLPTYAPIAEERCWRGFKTSRGAEPPASVPFHLSIGAGGEVTRAEPDLGGLSGAEVPAGFPGCLAQIIGGMRFPASGEAYLVRVQAERPPSAGSATP
jgi:hypothetical protein